MLLSLFLLLICLDLHIFYNVAFTFPVKPNNIFAHGPTPLSYRTLLLNPKLNSLYVGARGHLFRLWPYNINDTSSSTLYAHREFSVRPEEREECLRLGNTERECSFWVRQIFLRKDGSLLLCSSQAMKPQLGPVDGQALRDLQEPRTQIGICSQHDELNTTAVYTELGNPDGLTAIYSGIRTGLSLENHLIYRPPLMSNTADSSGGGREIHPALRTSIYDSNWLNEPQFVGSFTAGPYVYFFFRELLSTDCYNCPGISAATGKGIIVSRVARLCKSDLGGRQVLRQVWTSFVKARLNCSLSGFSFDQIQAIAVADSIPNSQSPSNGVVSLDTMVYATFIAAEHTMFQASAICAFSLNKINQLFDTGFFLEQSATGSGSWWNPTPVDQVPTNRPGSCQPDSRQLSDEELHFAKSHLLMADFVQPIGGQPFLHRHKELFTRLVADPLRNLDTNGREERDDDRENFKMESIANQILLFAYSSTSNSLFKLIYRPNLTSANLLAIYRLPSSPMERVHSMVILPGEYLYLSTESKVSQYQIGQCQGYGQRCIQCVQDPYCSWSISNGQCFSREPSHSGTVGWLTFDTVNNFNTSVQHCAKWTKPSVIRLYPGDSVHLECPSNATDNEELLSGMSMEWTFNGELVQYENTDNQIHSRAGGLVLLNVTDAMSGIWACRTAIPNVVDQQHPQQQSSLVLAEYDIQIDGEDCAHPKSVEQFHAVQREWCRRMDAYRSNLSKWQNLYEENANNEDGQKCPTAIKTAKEPSLDN